MFDTSFYQAENPEVEGNPIEHYLLAGWRQGKDPHPLFDTSWYLEGNPDLAAEGGNPLTHFVTSGWQQRRDPHPLFDVSYYLNANADVVRAGVNPAVHYITSGWRDARNPHPLFDSRFYLERNPDVGGNPLADFLGPGSRAGRDPHPLFDTSFYRASHPEVAENPLVHFTGAGWRAGHDPHPLFDTSYYLETYPDIARTDLNPTVHFVTAGWKDRRNPHPMFDTGYYLDQNPDVAARGVDPLAHFLTLGMGEGRLPSARFDPALTASLPDVAWEAGESRVERVVRTFVLRRHAALADAEIRRLVEAINGLATSPADEPAVSVVVPVFNQLKFTLWCLHAVVSAGARHAFEIVVVDDGSTDGTAEVLKDLAAIRYVSSPANQGFVGACNRGARHARGRHIVFLNNDTLPLPGWLDALVDTFADRPRAGLVGAKLVYPDGRLQEAGAIVWQDGAVWNVGRGGDRARPEHDYLRSVDFSSGAAIAVPADLFVETGGFDDAFAPAYGEDVDLALRLRARGLEVLYQPRSEVIHLEGVTAGTSTSRGVKAHQVTNLERLFERWRIPLRAHRPEGQETEREKERGVDRRVLFVDLFTPRPDQDAGSLDALHWMRSLAALGYQVTFAAAVDFRHAGRYTADLQRQGIECVYEPWFSSAEEFVQARGAGFDLVVFYRFEAADALMRVVKGYAPQARRLLGLCDLAHVRLARRAAVSGKEKDLRVARETRLRELLACAESDAVFTPSVFEKEVVVRELPDADVFVCPLVQDVRPPGKPFAERSGIGFIGGYRHAPNVDAVEYLVREVLPHVLDEEPGLELRVAGSHMPPAIAGIAHPAVRVLGHVDDLHGFFEDLRLTVAPIRFGAGVKGKVAASFAAGVPVVGTTLALEGMGLGHEEGALAADDPRELARAIVRLHRDEALWNKLSRSGLRRAERDFSTAAGDRNVAAATLHLGVATARARELGGTPPPAAPWSGIEGMEVDVVRTEAEYLALRKGDAYRRRVAFEERLLEDADHGEVVHRGYSFPARRPVVYRAAYSLDAAGKRWSGWREELLCPVTRLNNRQRAMAAFAERLLVREPAMEDVYLTEQVTPLFQWMSSRYRTVRMTGSEYIGPGVPSGEVRDGIRHEDIEKLALATESQDLILSCDVLEHVNEPEAALRELARVLRPGGHLLFTVPFMWHAEQNRRRSRAGNGTIEHYVTPSYHGNPMDPAGSLAYFDYGWELLDWVRRAGFREVSLICYWSDTLGHLGGMLEAFHARR
jgi:GT2 family glycosyltransferase